MSVESETQTYQVKDSETLVTTNVDYQNYIDGPDQAYVDNHLLQDGSEPITGSLEIIHNPTESDDHSLEIDTFVNGLGDIKSVDIVYDTGALASGTDEAVMLINVDESSALGGDITGLEMLATGGGADKLNALFAGAGINPIEQLSGSFTDAGSILVNAADETVQLSTGGAGNVPVFVADNDTMTIGSATKFEEIEFILDTVSSGSGIAPTFEYSTGVGTWATFTPVDGTNGMRNTGVTAWLDGDIPTWAVGAGAEYLIRITRTRNSLGTTPILDLAKVVGATEYYWNKDGDISVKNVYASNSLIVGATSGSQKLTVQDGNAFINQTGGGVNSLLYLGHGTGAGTYGNLKWNQNNQTLSLGYEGNEHLTIDNGGNVDVQTGNLEVSSGYISLNNTGYLRTDVANTFTMQGGSLGYAFRNNANSLSLMTLSDSGTLSVSTTTLTGGGFLGVGTPAPSHKLHVVDGNAWINQTGASVDTFLYLGHGGGAGQYGTVKWNQDNQTLSLGWENNEHLVVSNTGDVTIANDLEIQGGVLAMTNNGTNTLQMTSSTTSTCTINLGDTLNTTIGQIQYNHVDNDLAFKVNGLADAMVLDSSGNLGLGTSTIALDVGTSNKILAIEDATNPGMAIKNTTAGIQWFNYVSSSGAYELFKSTSPTRLAMSVTETDMFIYQDLEVGNVAGSAAEIQMRTDNTGICSFNFGDALASRAGAIDYNHTPNSMAFVTNATTTMVLRDGNMGVGTTGPIGKVHIKADVDSVNEGLYLESYNGTYKATLTVLGSDGTVRLLNNGNGGIYIDNNSDVGINATSPSSTLHVYDNNATKDASIGLTIEQGGAGDASMNFLLTGENRISIGLDNETTNKFAMCEGGTLGTDNFFEYDPAVTGIGLYGVTPVAQATKISDPSGGATQDAEARTAINAIIDALEGIGITASV